MIINGKDEGEEKRRGASEVLWKGTKRLESKSKKDESGHGIAIRSVPIFLSLRDIEEFLFYFIFCYNY